MSDHAVATREEATPDLICDHAYRAVCPCGWEHDQVRGWSSARKKAQEHVDLHALAVWGDELRAAERAVWVARIDAAMREQVRLRDAANMRGIRNPDAFLRHYGAVDALMDLLASVVSEEPAPSTEGEQT